VPTDHDDLPLAADAAAPTAAEFDRAFSAAAASPGVRRVWELTAPELPPQIEPFSFVSADLLRHVALALGLSPGQNLVDLGCGRGGPGLWLAREADASLIGVDFSPVAVDQAAYRAVPDDARLPSRIRINWPQLLRSAGFADIELAAQPEWHDLWTRLYRVALDLGDPGGDAALADLQDEARQRLPVANLVHRVAVAATAPDR